jgi:hypothetical protein
MQHFKQSLRFGPCACLLMGCLLLSLLAPAIAKPPQTARVVLAPALQADAVFEVRGLSKEAILKLKKFKKNDPRWKTLLEVKVDSAASADLPAMLGSYRLKLSGDGTGDGAGDESSTGGVVQFKPRFPLQPGLKYRTAFDPSTLSATSPKAKPLIQTFKIPKLAKHTPARIVAIYPSSGDLPENLLKFYLQFSAPMSIGDSYRHIHLRDASGKKIDLPFLELPEELWNSKGTRLTLLLDPGRIKRGLKPREDSGPVLVNGHRYTLEIDRAWQDAKGQALAAGLEKKFAAAAADTTQPDPKRWKLTAPKAKSRKKLSIQFREALDHAMLQHVIRVLRDDTEIAGTITLSQNETRWHFVPDQDWQAGQYRLAIATVLEDRAGNSIGRAFEVDLKKKSVPNPTPGSSKAGRAPQASKPPKTVYVRFTIENIQK